MDRKADTAYTIIKSNIINGKYPPMTDLSDELLQKELGYSRTPVREALLRLNDEGFIVVFPKKGTIVSPVTQELINEVYEARLVIEPYICQKATAILPVTFLEHIKEEFQTDQKFDSLQEQRSYFISLDDKLHTNILHCCNNRFIQKNMDLIYAHNDRFRNFSSQPTTDNSISEHIAIIDAMLSKDLNKVAKAAIDHIESSKQITIKTFLTSNVMNFLNNPNSELTSLSSPIIKFL